MSISIAHNCAFIIVAAMLVPAMSTAPAFASPKGVGGGGLASITKHFDDYCSSIKGEMMINEDLASAAVDAHQDPKPYEAAADAAFDQAAGAGCGWAQ